MSIMWTQWKRRRNFFVKKEMQGRYIFMIFLFVVFSTLLFTFIFSQLSADTMTITYKDSVLKVGRTPVMLAKQMLKANWIFILTGGFFIAFLAMFVTHRFAGPIHRLEGALLEMIGGDYSSVIRLRTNDEGKELAGMINRHNEKMSVDIQAFREASLAIRNCLQTAAESSDPGEASARLAEASRLSAELHSRLGDYKIRKDS